MEYEEQLKMLLIGARQYGCAGFQTHLRCIERVKCCLEHSSSHSNKVVSTYHSLYYLVTTGARYATCDEESQVDFALFVRITCQKSGCRPLCRVCSVQALTVCSVISTGATALLLCARLKSRSVWFGCALCLIRLFLGYWLTCTESKCISLFETLCQESLLFTCTIFRPLHNCIPFLMTHKLVEHTAS